MQYFGTDGIRGPVGGKCLNPPFVRRFGWALGSYIAQSHPSPLIAIGRDTRESGLLFTEALAQGLQAAGARVIDLGVAPTPAISFCVKKLGAQGAISITASHNPACDNGLKPFDSKGLKLTQAAETTIEALIDNTPPELFCTTADAPEHFAAAESYITFFKSLVPAQSLTGLKIVLDTAHGATTRTSPAVLRHAGVELILVGNLPNGNNINDGVGSEHPNNLAAAVLKHQADGGLAHDGDGDRLVCVDAHGKVISGDVILGTLGLAALEAGSLGANTLVATVQSNFGLDRAIEEAGGRVVRTAVGDRNVLHALLETGSTLGGESSGHFIFPKISPCGDGLIAALEILKFLKTHHLRFADLHTKIPLFPQKLVNLPVRVKQPLNELLEFQGLCRSIEADLGQSGRLLVRYSGTENKLRLLAEGPDEAALESHLAKLVASAQKSLG